MPPEDPFAAFELADRLQLVIFELELAGASRSLIESVWQALESPGFQSPKGGEPGDHHGPVLTTPPQDEAQEV